MPSKDFYFAYNSPSWYLCNTLFYCVIFPFLLRFIVDCKRNVRRAFLVSLLLVYVLLVIFLPKEWHHAILYVNPFVRILDFVLGIYTALLFFNLREDSKLVRQKSLLNTVVFVCFVVLAWVSFSLTGTEVYELFKRFYWLLFCPMILAVSLKSSRSNLLQSFDNQAFTLMYFTLRLIKCANKTMQWGGTYSFTFYLIHPLCIGLFGNICSKIDLGVWPTVFFTFTGTIVVSVLLQKYYLKPVAQIIMCNFFKIKYEDN